MQMSDKLQLVVVLITAVMALIQRPDKLKLIGHLSSGHDERIGVKLVRQPTAPRRFKIANPG